MKPGAKKKSMIKRFFNNLIIAMALAVILAGNILQPGIFAASQENDIPAGFSKAAGNEIISLFYSEEKAAVIVRDDRNGKSWSSIFAQEEYPAGEITDTLMNDFKSLILLNYSEMNLINAKDITESLAALDPEVETGKLDNGVKFRFYIPELSLGISIYFTIEDDSLIVKIPGNGIEEAVGTSARIQENLADVYIFADYIKADLAKMKSDSRIPGSIKKDIPSLEKMADTLVSHCKAIPDAMGIEVVSNSIIKELDGMQRIYAGSLSNTGLYNKIMLDGSIQEEVRDEYNERLTFIEDYMTLSRISAGSLKLITVGGVVSIALMPYFGASGDRNEGYVFYPDGSGAITRFGKNHSKYSFGYVKDIYSDDKPNIDWEQVKYDAGIRNTNIPVFGIRRNGAAFVSDIEKGDSNSRISYYPSGYIIDVNRAYFSFVYRRKMVRDKEAGVLQQGSANEIYEEKIRAIDFSARFMFLAAGDADYSGMADRLRRQMIKDGRLVKSGLISGDLNVGIEFFGGIEQKRLIYKEFISMTSFDQAGSIVSDLNVFDDIRLLINYKGWSANGIDKFPTGNDPAGKLGGKAGLVKLAEYIKAGGGGLFLEGNYIEAQAGQKGYSNGDLALSSALRPLASAVSLDWIISPFIVSRNIASNLGKYKKYGIAGITFDKIGTFLYYDYSTEAAKKTDREGTALIWKTLLGNTVDELGNSAVISGNSYTFADADWIIKAPRGSSEYVFTTESVPFYEMLIHGIIPYTIKAFNNFSDYDYEKLVTIEYGGIPYFLLAYEDSTKLGDLSVSMFTGRYEDFKGYISDTISEFIKNFGNVSDKQMTNHYRPAKGQAVIEYSNDIKVYINYNSEKAVIEGVTVDAKDYTVTGKERSVDHAEKIFYDETAGKSLGIPVYIALAVGISGILCLSFILFRRSRVQ